MIVTERSRGTVERCSRACRAGTLSATLISQRPRYHATHAQGTTCGT